MTTAEQHFALYYQLLTDTSALYDVLKKPTYIQTTTTGCSDVHKNISFTVIKRIVTLLDLYTSTCKLEVVPIVCIRLLRWV